MKFIFSILAFLLLLIENSIAVKDPASAQALQRLAEACINIQMSSMESAHRTASNLAKDESVRKIVTDTAKDIGGAQGKQFAQQVLDVFSHADKVADVLPSRIQLTEVTSNALSSGGKDVSAWFPKTVKSGMLSARKSLINPMVRRNVGLTAVAGTLAVGTFVIMTNKNGQKFICETQCSVNNASRHVNKKWEALLRQVKVFLTEEVVSRVDKRIFARSVSLTSEQITIYAVLALAAMSSTLSLSAQNFNAQNARLKAAQGVTSYALVKFGQRLLQISQRFETRKRMLLIDWGMTAFAMAVVNRMMQHEDFRTFVLEASDKVIGTCKAIGNGIVSPFRKRRS